MERGEVWVAPDGFPVSLEACIQAEQSIKFVQAVSGWVFLDRLAWRAFGKGVVVGVVC